MVIRNGTRCTSAALSEAIRFISFILYHWQVRLRVPIIFVSSLLGPVAKCVWKGEAMGTFVGNLSYQAVAIARGRVSVTQFQNGMNKISITIESRPWIRASFQTS